MGKKRQPIIDMTWQNFSRILLTTNDLDPVYVMLYDAVDHGLEHRTLCRFLLAYWCYYNCGVAAYVAEHADFYTAMWRGIAGRVPRGMERRHFWGKQAEDTIRELEAAGDPESIVHHMCYHEDFWDVFNIVKSYRGFGPWMGWKIADMAERVLRFPVDFSTSTLAIYKDPVAGAAFVRFGDRYHDITEDELSAVVNDMLCAFQLWTAPPAHDRPVNIQEVETFLCKYKAHCYGAYPVGNDIHHVGEGMRGWGDLSEWLLGFLPKWPHEDRN